MCNSCFVSSCQGRLCRLLPSIIDMLINVGLPDRGESRNQAYQISPHKAISGNISACHHRRLGRRQDTIVFTDSRPFVVERPRARNSQFQYTK